MEFKSNKISYAGIKGSTVINHRIRVKLGLSCEEYVIADYFHHRDKEEIKFKENPLWVDIGMNPGDMSSAVLCLRRKGIVNISETTRITPTDLWTKEFESKNEEKFEEFWGQVYGRIGNKVTAKKKFNEVLKHVSYDHLVKQHHKYVEHLEQNTWKQKMHCSVWINIKNKRFNDEYEVEKSGFQM